jgi:hypothetical protein
VKIFKVSKECREFKKFRVFKKIAVSSLAIVQIACVQALTPARVQPDPVLVPAPHTQTFGTVGNHVSLMVRDTATQTRLPIYLHRGEYWVAGVPGQGYELWLTGRMIGRRVLATTSVDGINVITGETAATIGRGYVISTYSTSTVKGWRKSEHEVAAFNFAAPSQSYAAQTGRPANVGVIGVAVFPELRLSTSPVTKSTPAPVSPIAEIAAGGLFNGKDNKQDSHQEKFKSEAAPTASIAATAPRAAASAATTAPAFSDARGSGNSSHNLDDGSVAKKSSASTGVAQGLGTQHGDRIASHSPTVAFKRESNTPAEVIQLRYDTTENLVARGVLQWQSGYPTTQPLPIPTPFPKNNYVPDPPKQ